MTQVEVLDHYYLKLRNGCYATVVGNSHFEYGVISYIKYCPTNRETFWRDNTTFLDRIVKYYDVEEVYKAAPRQIYVPYFDSYVPYVGISEIEYVFNPVERTREIMRRPRDLLEDSALALVEKLHHVVTEDRVGITGSLLPSIHNPNVSDIDLVIYGWKASVDVIEFVKENKDLFRVFDDNRLTAWAERNAKQNSLPLKEVIKYYRSYRRGFFKDREYSIIYNSGIKSYLPNLPYFKTLGLIEVEAEIRGGIQALDYPSRGKVHSWKILNGVNPPFDISEILSFEALYIPLLYEGGKAVIRGLLQCSEAVGYCRIILGVKEYRGYAIWID
ncbi:hypothetical protein ACSU1N_05140 [Thermogladius sp. 4427co]|uniref:hypothetical protein n=1 Tax=Thermogladius sp. 4427co TaxID=3450718 RepID=UPI003F7B013A